jgi:hypothetical protein
MMLLNGNQTMVLMTAFLFEKWQKANKITGKQFVGTTIVSTPMMMELATAYDVECKVGLTGFKWIAKMIKDFPELEFIGGGEESFGFMVGDAVRDKDAVASTLLICEIAAQAKANGSSVYQELLNLYVDYGFYKEFLVSITKKGIEGLEEIKQMMVDMRTNTIKEINGERIIMMEDYQTSIATNLLTGEKETMSIPKSDVLIYYTDELGVSESSRSNLFFVKAGVVYTPGQQILAGITRSHVMSLAAKEFEVRVGDYSLDDFLSADEVFTTGSTKRVLPIFSIDGKQINGAQRGKLTAHLYELLVKSEC